MRSSVLAQGEESCWSLDVDADNSPPSSLFFSFIFATLILGNLLFFSLFRPSLQILWEKVIKNISVAKLDIYVLLGILVANSSDCIELEAHTLLISGENKAARLPISRNTVFPTATASYCALYHRSQGYSLSTSDHKLRVSQKCFPSRKKLHRKLQPDSHYDR